MDNAKSGKATGSVVTNLGPVHNRSSLPTLLETGGSTRHRDLLCKCTLR